MNGWTALAALWLMLSMSAGVPTLAARDRSEPITQKIERERQTLEKLKEEIEEKKKHADEAEKKRGSVLQAIQDLDHRLLLSRQERQEINRKLKEKDREIEAINAQLVALKARIIERRSALLARLRVQYMEGRFGYLKVLLASENYAGFLLRVQYLSTISRREYDLLEAYSRDVGQAQAVERERTRVRDEMLTYKLSTERKLQEVQGLKRDKHLFLARVIQEKESYDRAVTELERSAARVDVLLRELEERRKAAAPLPRKKDMIGWRAFKGLLQWPAEGDVVSFFGRQKHPVFETYVQRKGIEIRTEEGSAIRAVMSGTVAYADWLKGYGLIMIMDHGNGFFSLYAHASKLLVKVGDQVRTGQVIGETGDTGVTGDNTLYFELREGADPVDPLAWLAKRR